MPTGLVEQLVTAPLPMKLSCISHFIEVSTIGMFCRHLALLTKSRMPCPSRRCPSLTWQRLRHTRTHLRRMRTQILAPMRSTRS